MQNSSNFQGFTAFSDAVRFVMDFAMAFLAKRDTVRHIEAQIGIVSKGLDMVSIQVAATIITTMLTGEMIAGEYIEAPTFILSREPQAPPLNRLAVFVTMRSGAARRFLAVGSADLQSCFDRVPFTQSWLFSFVRFTHLTFGFLGMLMALKGRYAAFRVLPFFDTNARLTARRQAVAPIAIDIEYGAWLPCLATMTPLQTGVNFRRVLIQGQTQPTSGDFQYT